MEKRQGQGGEMINLPMTYAEAAKAEALAFAREYVARRREGDFLDLGYPLLHPEVSKAFAQRLIRMAMLDADIMLQVIDAAYLGWRDGRDALDSLIFDLTNAHQPLPSFLADYNARSIKGTLPPRLRGGQKSSNILQDIFIVTLIMELAERFDMQPTRR
jgi:hypothetical protein